MKNTIIIALALAVISGCRENTVINAAVSPSGDPAIVKSVTLPVITHSFADLSVVTSLNIGGIPVLQAAGSLSDPFFGTMTAATYFQLYAPNPDPTVFNNSTVDSAVMFLPYGGFTYGDTSIAGLSATEIYQVFYLGDTLSQNTNYYSSSAKQTDDNYPLSGPTPIVISHLRDSFGVNQLPSGFPSARIRLNSSILMSHLLPALTAAAASENPLQTFVQQFNGICVRPSDTRSFCNAIPYFRLDGTDTFSQAGIVVYYHNANGNNTQYYYFNPLLCAHFNGVTKSFNRFPVNDLISSPGANDAVVALQSQPGESIDVVIPGITSLPAGVINKAELQLTLLPAYYSPNHSNDTLFAPFNLIPIGVASGVFPAGIAQGALFTLDDQYPTTSVSPLSLLDGSLHSISTGAITVQTYSINIPREVINSRAAGNDTLHLDIRSLSSYFGAFHMVAGGGSYPDSLYRAKFVVTYTKLEQ